MIINTITTVILKGPSYQEEKMFIVAAALIFILIVIVIVKIWIKLIGKMM